MIININAHPKFVRKHQYFQCSPCEQPGYCRYCDGGLAFCTVCNQAECELEASCPGAPSLRSVASEG